MDSKANLSSLEEEHEGVGCGWGAQWRELVSLEKRNLDQLKASLKILAFLVWEKKGGNTGDGKEEGQHKSQVAWVGL